MSMGLSTLGVLMNDMLISFCRSKEIHMKCLTRSLLLVTIVGFACQPNLHASSNAPRLAKRIGREPVHTYTLSQYTPPNLNESVRVAAINNNHDLYLNAGESLPPIEELVKNARGKPIWVLDRTQANPFFLHDVDAGSVMVQRVVSSQVEITIFMRDDLPPRLRKTKAESLDDILELFKEKDRRDLFDRLENYKRPEPE